MWRAVQSRYQKTRRCEVQKTGRCGVLFSQDIRRVGDVACCSVKISEDWEMWCAVQSRYQKTRRCGVLFSQDIRRLGDVACCSVKISED